LADNVLNLVDFPDSASATAAGEEWVRQRASQVGLLKALDEYADELLFVMSETERGSA
jgi:hypothetical protein